MVGAFVALGDLQDDDLPRLVVPRVDDAIPPNPDAIHRVFEFLGSMRAWSGRQRQNGVSDFSVIVVGREIESLYDLRRDAEFIRPCVSGLWRSHENRLARRA